MNTNSNVYTVVYTTVVVVVVAAVLAFVAMTLKPRQIANIKAETLSQMMTAAQLGTKAEISAQSNDAILNMYSDEIAEAFTIDLNGQKVADLCTEKSNIELIDGLKGQNKCIKAGEGATLPVYVFKSGKTVIPVYGAGLWGPVWGYLALDTDLATIAGAYFDHESETPGLGAKIKDDPAFAEQFKGKKLDLESAETPFSIIKVGSEETTCSNVDAITGATMTSKGLEGAVRVWVAAYIPYLKAASQKPAEETNVVEETSNE